MKKLNWFYIALLMIAFGLVWFFLPRQESDVAFFGFAESLETEINYNYPVLVEEILVTPGQQIDKDSPLIRLSRRSAKEEMQQQNFEISTLRTEMNSFKQKQASEKLDIVIKYQEDAADLDKEVQNLKLKIERLNNLKAKLFNQDTLEIKTLQTSLSLLQSQRSRLDVDHEQRLTALETETNAANSTFLSEIKTLEAARDFEIDHKIQSILVKAPQAGLIGNINCREGEHSEAFKTLMTFYEPHSTLVKGYVHEESILEIGSDVSFEVSSLIKTDVRYKGKLIGMGSRIVEIPPRLRKFAQVKTYGREITIEIPSDNIFLQKEKVSVKVFIGQN